MASPHPHGPDAPAFGPAPAPAPRDTRPQPPPDGPTAAAYVGRAAYPFLSPARQPGELGRLGPYRVLGVIGRGGMGMVFRAEDPQLRRQVALKVMLPDHARDPHARQRFLREAQLQAAVDHDHIIPIYQVGEDNDTPFIAMPLLKGRTLAAAVLQNPRPTVRDVLRVGREVAEGLAAAHATGLIHRDIKPSNVWLEGDRRRVKILDFGLARSAAHARTGDGPLTASNVIVGTPQYMSPEQARGKDLDGRSDLFSLGVVLYELVCGRLPFEGSDTMAVLTALAVDALVPPRDLVPDLPPAVNDFILRLLAKHPGGRPATAAAAAEELRTIEDQLSQPFVAVPLIEYPPAADPFTAIGELPTATVAARRPRSAALWAWGVVAAVVLAGGVALTGQVIRVVTPKGTLVIETDDPAVEVTVTKGGAVVRDRTRDREIVLGVGDYGIELAEAKGGLKLSTKAFTIEDGGKARVRVRVEPKVAEVAPRPRAVVSPDRAAAEWVLAVGGQVSVNHAADKIAAPAALPDDPVILTKVWLADVTAVNDHELARFRDCTELTELWMYHTRVSDAGLDHLRKLTKLTALDVAATFVSDPGLARVRHLSALTVLNIQSSRVTDAGLAHCHALRALRHIDVRELKVSRKALDEFHAAVPGCAIHTDGGMIPAEPPNK